MDRLRRALGEAGHHGAWAEGRATGLADAVALVRRTRGRRTRATSGWASLTPTEEQVVELVAEGLTNPEIAAKLAMRRSTVKTHLLHVFTKLEVTSRTELATATTRRRELDRR